MALDCRLARDMAPFGAATLLGFAIVPIANDVAWSGYALAAAVMLAAAGAAVLAPWQKLPRSMRVAPSLLFLVSVALLRDASGVVAGVGVLTLVPVFWLALYGSRGQLLLLIAGVCAFFLAPAVLAGAPKYPLGIWRVAVVFGAASAIVGIAVQNLVARVRGHADALAVRERDLEAVADLLRSLSLVTDARERICVGTCDLSGAQFAVLLEGRSDDTLVWTAGAGLSLRPRTFTPASGASWAMEAYRSRTAMLISDPDEQPQGAELEGHEPSTAILFEPVHHGDDVVGVLVVGWREPPSDERRARGLVRLLASEAAFVIERADLLGRMTELALTDVLTGLPNRRAWEDHLGQAIRDTEPICVAILDLDLFKSYNDDHGHLAGDRLLKEAAAAWRAELRPTDTLARYGGEEFVVLLREHDLEVARGVVDRLRAATPRGQSCSAGVARRERGEAAAALLGRADAALYDAKRAGRNRSLLADVD